MKLEDLYETRKRRLLWLRANECSDKNVILADKIGKSDSYVSRMFLDLENKNSKRIGETVARHIEQVFQKPKYWLDALTGDIETTPDNQPESDTFEECYETGNGVKIVGEAMLGSDGTITEIKEISGHLSLLYPGNPYALKIKGNSLWPRINSGELIIVNPDHEVSPGDEVLIHTTTGSDSILVYNFSRNGECYFSCVNSTDRPIVLSAADVESMYFIGAIVKPIA